MVVILLYCVNHVLDALGLFVCIIYMYINIYIYIYICYIYVYVCIIYIYIYDVYIISYAVAFWRAVLCGMMKLSSAHGDKAKATKMRLDQLAVQWHSALAQVCGNCRTMTSHVWSSTRLARLAIQNSTWLNIFTNEIPGRRPSKN